MSKRILYCQVKFNNKYINIFNSHLNNDTPLIYSDKNNIPLVKKNQLNEFLIYINKIIQNNKYIICDKKDIIYIIAGDLNLNFKSKLYTNFIKKLKKNLNVSCNKKKLLQIILKKSSRLYY